MDVTGENDDGQTLDDVLALNDPELHADHLQLYRAVMITSGEAAQTFAAMKRLAKRVDKLHQTFASAEKIREVSMLPRRTTQEHLKRLEAHGWIRHEGRHGRRTPTYSLDLHRLGPKPKFAKLPRAFADPSLAMFKAWSTRAVIAAMISQDMLPEQYAMDNYGCLDGREYARTTFLAKVTGLSQKSVLRAVNLLACHRFLVIYEPDTAYQKVFEVGLNSELMITLSVLPPRVAGKDKPALLRHEPTAPKSWKGMACTDESGSGLVAIWDGQSCAGRQDKSALKQGQSCAKQGQIRAKAGTNLRSSRDKPALAVSKKLLRETIGEKPLVRSSCKETLGQNSGSTRTAVSDQIFVDVDKDRDLAAQLLDRMRWDGTDGALVWKSAAWLRHSTGVTLADLVDSAQGVREIGPIKPVGYFRSNLNGRIGEQRVRELEKRTRLPTGFDPRIPKRRVDYIDPNILQDAGMDRSTDIDGIY